MYLVLAPLILNAAHIDQLDNNRGQLNMFHYLVYTYMRYTFPQVESKYIVVLILIEEYFYVLRTTIKLHLNLIYRMHDQGLLNASYIR